MHPMERLRYVARAGSEGVVAAELVVSETADSIAALRPEPAELLTVLRQLVQRNPSCGPLWWLGAHLLHGGTEQLLSRRDEIADDPTARRVAEALPDAAAVATVGRPELVGRAVIRRGDVRVLAIDAGDAPMGLARLLDRGGIAVDIVDVAATVPAVEAADVALVEIVAAAETGVLTAIGGGLLAAAARAAGTALWLVAGRGTRLPNDLFAAAARLAVPAAAPWSGIVEHVGIDRLDPTTDRVVGPDGIQPIRPEAFTPECPLTPELIPPSR